jgi:hypothetical protein
MFIPRSGDVSQSCGEGMDFWGDGPSLKIEGHGLKGDEMDWKIFLTTLGTIFSGGDGR